MLTQTTLEQYFRDLEMLVNVDSGQDAPEGIRRNAEFFRDAFDRMGWLTELQDIGPTGPCLVVRNREAEHYDLLLTGHLDTVFPKGTAARRPYREEENTAYGPGICDMKSGCLTMLYALQEVPAEVLEKLNILLIFQPDEEIGSIYSKELMCAWAEKCRVCLVFEAAVDAPSPLHCVQRKGMLRLGFRFYGRAGHAGSMLTNGAVSAISEMAYWISRIDTLVSREKNTTANVGLVRGGIGNNVVAAEAEMSGEIRFEFPEEAEKAKVLIRELYRHAEATGVRVERTLEGYEPPMNPTPQTLAYVDHLNTLEAQNGRTFSIRKRGGLSAANFLSQHLPICVDGFGPAGEKAHSEDEYMLMDSVAPSIRLTAQAICALAKEKG